MIFQVRKKIVTVPYFIPTMVSAFLVVYVFTRGLDYAFPAGAAPQEYLRGLGELGYVAWGWTLLGCAAALSVGIVLRFRKRYLPLMIAHTVTGILYGVLTTLIMSAGWDRPHALRAWVGTAVTAGFHILRFYSLLFERLTELGERDGTD